MVSSKEVGIFPTALIASPAATLAWPYKSCTLSSACRVWPCGFLAVPLKAIFVHSDAPAVWVPTTLALNANASAQRCGSHYPLITTHKSGSDPEWKGSRHSLTCTTRSHLGGLPIAPTHATNKKADTKRYERRCVRTFFDRMADIILSIHRAVADRLGGI